MKRRLSVTNFSSENSFCQYWVLSHDQVAGYSIRIKQPVSGQGMHLACGQCAKTSGCISMASQLTQALLNGEKSSLTNLKLFVDFGTNIYQSIQLKFQRILFPLLDVA